MEDLRRAGVLCHITSLPGDYGIGTLGKEAYRFAKSLAASGVKVWQILPLVQTGYGDSPYQSVSYSSGNPYLIDPELLAKEKLLTKEERFPALTLTARFSAIGSRRGSRRITRSS